MNRVLNFGLSLVRIGFKSSKCKTMAKLVIARIKLLRNKREVVVRQMRRDVALLLQSGQDSTARIRVEHVMREQNIMAANEIIELFCELVVARLSIIAKQKACPADLKEGISSLIFAAPRCSDIPELLQIRTIFEKKYGKEFVNAATELRPNCGVNRTLIEKLSVRTPTGEVKLKLMKEIAKEYQIAWDHKETEDELLKPSEDLIEGPSKFVSAASMPVKTVPSRDSEWNQPIKPMSSQHSEWNQPVKPIQPQGSEWNQPAKPTPSQGGEWNQSRRLSNDRENPMNYEDSAAAAKVAADSAEKAVAAAQAAAYLANRSTHQVQPNGYHTHSTALGNSEDRSQHFERSHILGNEESKRIHRRHSYNAPTSTSAVHSDIKFDESEGSETDIDEEIEMEAPPDRMLPPPNRPPPPLPSSHAHQSDDRPETDNYSSYRRNSLPRVHPKLPDYEELSSRFEALKFRK